MTTVTPSQLTPNEYWEGAQAPTIQAASPTREDCLPISHPAVLQLQIIQDNFVDLMYHKFCAHPNFLCLSHLNLGNLKFVGTRTCLCLLHLSPQGSGGMRIRACLCHMHQSPMPLGMNLSLGWLP